MDNKRIRLNSHNQLTQLLSGRGTSTTGISSEEIEHLAWLGAQVPDGGNIVEIGTHRGKSICAIVQGMLSTGNLPNRVHAVDLWLKGKGFRPEHQASKETWEIFNRQIMAMGVKKFITPVMASSQDAVQRRSNPIHLLFIDGDHKKPGVLFDYNNWSPFIPSGGRIAFHDHKTRFKGVTQVIEETVIPSGLWEDFAVVGHIWSAVRK